MKITATMRAACLAMYQGKRPLCGWETLANLAGEAGLATFDGSVKHAVGDDFEAFALTEAGRVVARDEISRTTAARDRKNRAARGRSDAMRSLGMVKTPYGWE